MGQAGAAQMMRRLSHRRRRNRRLRRGNEAPGPRPAVRLDRREEAAEGAADLTGAVAGARIAAAVDHAEAEAARAGQVPATATELRLLFLMLAISLRFFLSPLPSHFLLFFDASISFSSEKYFASSNNPRASAT